MERIMLFTIISVAFVTCLVSGYGTDPDSDNIEQILIAQKILEDLLDIKGNRDLCKNDCYPGQCTQEKGVYSCLCPDGYYSDKGSCKEIEWNCKTNDCKPGKCIKELSKESCLCPEGFTAKAKSCIEITYSDTKRLSTIMLMIIIAIASMMFTTFLGVCICYFNRERNY